MSEPEAGGAPVRSSVLIVDDEPAVCTLLKRALEAEMNVFTASTSAEALDLLRAEGVDAVIADYMMPVMTGVELLVEARKLQPHAARVLITGSGRVEHARDGVNVAHISRFLSKPLRASELKEMVRGAIRETALERDNDRLVQELREKNQLLQRALCQVQAQERELERKVEERTRDLQEAMKRLEELALRDGLTGLYNHRFFQEALSSELARSARHQHRCGLIFIDVDHFKNYNDLAGHPAGDEVLRQIARLLVATGPSGEVRIRGRSSDIAARYGGEEFVIILPETDKEGALTRAERLRAAIEAFPFEHQHLQPGGRITVCIGVADYPEDGLSKHQIISAADDALLRAKRAGRNRVIAAASAAGEG